MLMKRLKFRRKELKLSQEQVARKLGISRQGYGHYETGRNEPDNETLLKLSEILKCTVDYLLGKTDDPEGYSSIEEKVSKALQLRDGENIYFYDMEGLTDEDIELLKEQIEVYRKMAEKKNKKKM